MRRTSFLLIPLALLVAGCGGDDADPTAADAVEDGGGHGGGHAENTGAAAGARLIEVTASSFQFDPTTIDAEEGEAIQIELTAADIEHDFVIVELDAHIGAEAGETGTGGFTAAGPGTYTYYCSVPGHREAGMEGELVVS